MKSPEVAAEFLTEINCWAKNNIKTITKEMESAHKSRMLLDTVRYEKVDKSLWPNIRSYSEMPICDHIWARVKPPLDFKVIPWKKGKVDIVDRSTGAIIDSCNHAYAQGPDNLVVCLTPGLFESYLKDDLLAGERLAKLKRKAPELITLYSDEKGQKGIAVLAGRKREIAAKLNLIYTTREKF